MALDNNDVLAFPRLCGRQEASGRAELDAGWALINRWVGGSGVWSAVLESAWWEESGESSSVMETDSEFLDGIIRREIHGVCGLD